jgi:hypothetical protein
MASSAGVREYSGKIPEPICMRSVFAAMKPSWLTASKLYASGTNTMSSPARS